MALTPEEEKELAELEAMESGQSRLTPEEEAELAQLESAQAEQPNIFQRAGQAALEGLSEAGRAIDQYTGAPTRAAIGAIQEGKNPLEAYSQQFGEEPEKAPTGKDIASKAGLSREEGILGVSPAGAVGLAVDIIADPLTFIPFGQVAKLGAKGGSIGLGMAAKAGGKALKGSAKAADILTGTEAASKTVKGIQSAIETGKETAKAVGNVVETYIKPKVSPDFNELKEIAVKNNIDLDLLPEAVEFGEGSFISRASRAKAEGPLGQAKLENFKKAQAQVTEALDRKLTEISPTILDAKDAGALIRQGYDEGVERFFSQMDTTYNSIAKKNPDLILEPQAQVKFNDLLSEIQSNALKRYKNPVNAIERQEAGNILQTVDAILKTGPDFKSSVDLLQRIGKYNFKPSTLLSSPIDAAANRKIYGQLRDAIIKTVEKVDKKAAIDLVENNKALTEFFGEQSNLSKIIGNKALSDEGLFKNLILSGDTKKIDALQSVLTPEQMNQLKSSFVSNLAKRSDEGIVSYNLLQNQLANKSSIVKKLFNENEIKEIGDILKLGRRLGSPVLSSSGTGASNVFKDLAKSVPDAIISDQVIQRMKNKARGIEGLLTKEADSAIDSLKGLTNEQAANKIKTSEQLKNIKKSVERLGGANPRSKASQLASTRETNKKKEE